MEFPTQNTHTPLIHITYNCAKKQAKDMTKIYKK